MNKRYLISFITPQVVERIISPVNGEITVELANGRYRASVGGYWQSGEYAKYLINEALDNIKIDVGKVKKILLLGLGCGSMVTVLSNRIPKASIIGIDVDEKMAFLGKKYFALNLAKNLEIIISDAGDYLSKEKKNKFEMIISDLFIGCDTKLILQSEEFVQRVFNHLTSGGIYISNCSYLKKYKEKTDAFLAKIKSRFNHAEEIRKYPNLIIRTYKI